MSGTENSLGFPPMGETLMSDETIIDPSACRLLAVIVKESPHSGWMKADRLDNGIVGIEPLDLAVAVRTVVRAGLVSRDLGDLQITEEGWKWIEDHRTELAGHLERPGSGNRPSRMIDLDE